MFCFATVASAPHTGRDSKKIQTEGRNQRQMDASKPAPGELLKYSVPEKLLKLASCQCSLVNSPGPDPPPFLRGGSFVCDYRNGAADVREFFAQLGWAQVAGPSADMMCNYRNSCHPAARQWNCGCVAAAVANLPDFTFYWGGLSSTSFALCYQASLVTKRPLVMNRIPWVTLISNKSQLAATCIAHRHSRDASICLQSHVPATFVIDRDTDRMSLPALARRLLVMHPVWIVKPHNYAKGEGIQLAFREDGEAAMLRSLAGDRWGVSKVVQCYMTDPLLLDKRKFDLRVFLLLVSTGDGLVAFYHQGYARLALNEFLVGDKTRLDTHLTNQAVQAKQSGYEANKEGTIWTVQQMNSYLNSEASGAFGADWTLNKLHSTIRSLVAALVEALVQRVQRERSSYLREKRLSHSQQLQQRYPCRNTFNLLGLDVLIDKTGKPWLIEANADPALSRQTRTLEHLLPSVTAEAFGLAAEIIARCHQVQACGAADLVESAAAFDKLEFLQNFQSLGYYRLDVAAK